MPLLTLGISHHTAPIEIRERVAVSPGEYGEKLASLTSLDGVEEALILSTCNRTEFYCAGDDPGASRVANWVHKEWDLDQERIDDHFYFHQGTHAVRHLIRVAGGLDSLVLGESQILGQLKQSWQDARQAGTVGTTIDRLCQHAVTTAKSIRHHSNIGDKPVSVAYTAIVLARQLFSDLDSRQVMLIGAGEMIELCARHLIQHGVTRLKIANRSLERAEKLALSMNAEPLALADLDQALPHADILITSTASDHAVVTQKAVKNALVARRNKPMFMVDIAVPRDVEPSVKKLDNVYLYTIDDLQQVVDENLEQRTSAAREAEPAIDNAVQQFVRWMNGARAADSLQLLRDSAHAHSQELVERALRRLEAGQDARSVLEQLSNTLANRILHAPSKNLRQAAEDDDLETLSMINRIYSPEDSE